MDVLLLIYNLLLQIFYCIPMVYSWILYQHTKKRLYLYITGLFLSYTIENMIICLTEFDTEFARLYNTIFMSVPTFRTVIFVSVLFFMLRIMLSILNENTNYILFSLLGLCTLSMLFIPMMKDGAIKVFVYYTICQLCSFLTALYGLICIKANPEQYPDNVRGGFYKTLLWTAVFSVLIIVEDYIIIFHFDIYHQPGIHIMNRSFTENAMSLYYVFTALHILVPYLHSHLTFADENDSASEPVQQDPLSEDTSVQALPANSFSVVQKQDSLVGNATDYSKFYLFSRNYELTPREQRILQLLLENKTNVEIGENLYISSGTAKAHVHNIFSKVNVRKRQQLIDVYEHYTPPKS